MIKNIDAIVDIKDLTEKHIAKVKQFDDINLTLEIRGNDKQVDINNNKITAKITTPDKQIFFQNTGITITEKNIVTIKLKKGAFTQFGIYKFELELDNLEGSISTATFVIDVLQAIDIENVPELVEYESIYKKINKISNINLLESKTPVDLQNKINEILNIFK